MYKDFGKSCDYDYMMVTNTIRIFNNKTVIYSYQGLLVSEPGVHTVVYYF